MMGIDRYESLEEIQNESVIPAGIGERCFIKNVIIDKNCRIGNDVHIHGLKDLKDIETDLYVIKDGIVVIKKNAIIPHGFSLK